MGISPFFFLYAILAHSSINLLSYITSRLIEKGESLMNRLFSYVGGLVGGLALSATTLTGTFLSELSPLFDFVSLVAILVFSGALVFEGIKALVNK